jgi:hypothetical protein
MHTADIKNWDKLPVADKLIYLRGFFRIGHIKHATRKELEDFLVLLAITPFTDNPKAMGETERYASVVQHLLQVRISEELHWRSFWVSIFAISISILALVVSAYEKYKSSDTHSLPPSIQQSPTTHTQ